MHLTCDTPEDITLTTQPSPRHTSHSRTVMRAFDGHGEGAGHITTVLQNPISEVMIKRKFGRSPIENLLQRT
jgi:hypothetical protein